MNLFVFAAARDGAMFLSSIKAENLEDARDAALKLAAEHHDVACDADEIEGMLDGFDIVPASEIGI